MDLLLKDNEKLFCDYAIRDSVIALAYWVGVHAITGQIGLKAHLTVGSIAIAYLNAYLKQAKTTRNLWLWQPEGPLVPFHRGKSLPRWAKREPTCRVYSFGRTRC